MFHIKYVFYFIFLPIIIGIPQINLHKTGWASENEFNNVFEQICLRVDTLNEEGNISREIISYCSNELPLRFDTPTNDFFPKFTFNQLSKENITSEQLYHWSTPIDIIEDYQFYLNELLTLNKSSLSDNLFYNCTLPRFGSICQYEMNYYHENYSSLSDLINDFYHSYTYQPTEMTCYKHLKCNRGYSTMCLDWTEICNEQIDCLNDGLDEEYCWQLEINECNSNEYRCQNGQCIPKEFFQDDVYFPDCFDGSDEIDRHLNEKNINYPEKKPSFICEDVTCKRIKHKPYTSSCVSPRNDLIIENMYSTRNNLVSDECWSALVCRVIRSEDPFISNCTASCEGDTCLEDIEYHCPDMFMIPTIPVIFSDIYFAYEKYKSTMSDYKIFQYPYLCYNNSRYDAYFKNDSNKSYNYSVVLFNNFTCHRLIHPFYLVQIEVMALRHVYILALYEQLWQYQQIYNYNSTICDRSNMYQCNNSLKCISKHRLMNGRNDCPNSDDENRTSANSNVTTEEILDINFIDINNDEIRRQYVREHISFQTICDGYAELSPINIDEQNETDETNCEQWPCNNIYTHCNHIWNCFDGADEINCNLSSSSSYCPSYQHQCVSPHTNQFICLPIAQANDGQIDCLGAVDEPKLCRTDYEEPYHYNFYCKNQGMKTCLTSNELCNNITECDDGEDEQFCIQNCTKTPCYSICWSVDFTLGSNVENFLCKQMNHYNKTRVVYFTLNEMKYLIENLKDKSIDTKSSLLNISDEYQHSCHRGIDLNIWLNNHTKQNICFCPPSYYGDRCQYQNQRISLSMKFRALSDSWQIPFAIIVLLIDNQQRIHSYEQFTYLSSRDCKIKHQIYFIYSNRPKTPSQNYGIHIDIYEKLSFKYRGSYFYPLQFTFLPVHRVSLMIQIPSNDKIENCLNNPCIDGKCIKYLNKNQSNDVFCQCYRGWSGRYCTIEHSSMCTYDSLYIDVSSDNRSICLCPLNRFGRRCLINRTICQNLTCQNGGQCIPIDEYQISTKNFVCICSNGFIGERCEINENEIILSFDKHIISSQSIFIHFIEVRKDRIPRRSTTLQTIPIQQDFIQIFWSRPFHIVFIEFFEKQYYLAALQTISNQSLNLSKTIDSSDRCLHINEIFNETILKLHLIRRIKYYHLPCQLTRLNLSCFYDDIHLCLCYYFQNQRLTSCFEFNHNMTFDCSGQSVCLHNGKCFQDTFDCPTKSICKCSSCFYGTRCQFSTNGFGLSLDAILGYQILPKVSLTHQLPIIKLSLTLTIIWIIAGLIDSILCMIIFKNKIVCEVGCGLYLLCSSIISLFTVILFGLKFVILLLTQMIIISNRTFLHVQCYSIDFLLQICLCMNQWLNACVAVERTVTVVKGTSFIKSKSKQAAKYVIIILLIVTIATGIHDPINRYLTDEDSDDNENIKRIWCIVSYSSSLEVYNYIIHIVHFFGPFIINFISAIILITKKSRQQSHIQKQKTYKELLRKQFHQHKNLLTAPIILIILALPRLIIAFVSKCMKTANDSWIFLIGYLFHLFHRCLLFLYLFYHRNFIRKNLKKLLINIKVL